MNNRIHTTIILAAAAFAACSGLERADIVPATETSRIMLVREGAADVSVYAFRRQGAVFLFDTLFREGWTPVGRETGAGHGCVFTQDEGRLFP